MRTVWKYEVSVGEDTDIPWSNSHVALSVGLNPMGGGLAIWVELDPKKECDRVLTVKVIGTGHDLDPIEDFIDYFGTVQQSIFMWHVYGSVA